MPLSKLNYLHWHLVDDEAFPLPSISHPELAEGAYDSKSRYSYDEIRDIIAFATKNGVNIIPEIDTPGHTRSWGLSAKWKAANITIKCPGGEGYNGQLDVSKDSVYTLVGDVLKEVDALFKDSDYLHLGGDEVSSKCWDLAPGIKTFMTAHHINNYGELQMYWRKYLRSVLSPTRKVVFWKNTNENVSIADDEVMHYWGAQNATADCNYLL